MYLVERLTTLTCSFKPANAFADVTDTSCWLAL